jgi:hypothetical protein
MPRKTQNKVAPGLLDGPDHIATDTETAVHDLNHRVRPCLNGRTSCDVFFESGKRPAFTKRGRRRVYDWVMERVERILFRSSKSGKIAGNGSFFDQNVFPLISQETDREGLSVASQHSPKPSPRILWG